MFNHQLKSLGIALTWEQSRLPWTLEHWLRFLQHLDYEQVQTERPGELVAYYKIARKDIFFLPL